MGVGGWGNGLRRVYREFCRDRELIHLRWIEDKEIGISIYDGKRSKRIPMSQYSKVRKKDREAERGG